MQTGTGIAAQENTLYTNTLKTGGCNVSCQPLIGWRRLHFDKIIYSIIKTSNYEKDNNKFYFFTIYK